MFDDLNHSSTSCAIAFACTMLCGIADAGEKWHVGSPVPAAARASIDAVDHSIWNDLTSRYADEDGMVAYAEWQADAKDFDRLGEYLNVLSAADRKRPAKPEARLAFWINAYNATTVRGILREYPTSSIRDHTAKLFGYNIWHDLLLHVGDDAYSLDQMEHEILRKLGEPRIHFAIVCASRGCPRLLNAAYTADDLEEQLEMNTRHFFAQSINFRYDAARGRFDLSPILKWFAEDFGENAAARLRFIAPYLPTEEARIAARAGSPSLVYLDYDWSLNEQSPPER